MSLSTFTPLDDLAAHARHDMRVAALVIVLVTVLVLFF